MSPLERVKWTHSREKDWVSRPFIFAACSGRLWTACPCSPRTLSIVKSLHGFLNNVDMLRVPTSSIQDHALAGAAAPIDLAKAYLMLEAIRLSDRRE
eukprot:5617731-Pleurochrysis_carterae.AAC.2